VRGRATHDEAAAEPYGKKRGGREQGDKAGGRMTPKWGARGSLNVILIRLEAEWAEKFLRPRLTRADQTAGARARLRRSAVAGECHVGCNASVRTKAESRRLKEASARPVPHPGEPRKVFRSRGDCGACTTVGPHRRVKLFRRRCAPGDRRRDCEVDQVQSEALSRQERSAPPKLIRNRPT